MATDAAASLEDAPGPRALRPPAAWPDALLAATLVLVLAAAGFAALRDPALMEPLLGLLALLALLLVLRALALARANRRLAASYSATDDFKTQLLRFISHEIANPLSPLKVQVDLLRQGVARDLDRAWATVSRSIARLESLSRDVRLMALAETHRIVQAVQDADLVPRVAAAVQAHQGVAAQRGVRLVGEMPSYPLVAPVDGERFDQVVDNLLSNALKFTPKDGTITVAAWRAPGGAAVVEVRDSGAGMDATQQARLFSAFGRPKGSTAPGLGLGLYLCKAIVDGHGGTISATSDGPGTGSRFRVELPAGRPSAAHAAAMGPPPRYRPQEHQDGVPDVRPPDLPL